MTSYFGMPWGVPALEDATHCPTPVGRACLTCEVPIMPGDRGWLRPLIRPNLPPIIVPIHAECDLAALVGHSVGICPCNRWPVRSRYTGLAVWAVVMERRDPDADYLVAAGGTHCADPGDTARIDTAAVRAARRPRWRRLLRRLRGAA